MGSLQAAEMAELLPMEQAIELVGHEFKIKQ